MLVNIRNFPEAIINQDILYHAGHPGNTQIGSVNVQVILIDLLYIHIVIQPRSDYSTINHAELMIKAIQKRLFDELNIDICMQANIYSYMEFANNNSHDITRIVTCRQEGSYTIKNDCISFDRNDIPEFLSRFVERLHHQ